MSVIEQDVNLPAFPASQPLEVGREPNFSHHIPGVGRVFSFTKIKFPFPHQLNTVFNGWEIIRIRNDFYIAAEYGFIYPDGYTPSTLPPPPPPPPPPLPSPNNNIPAIPAIPAIAPPISSPDAALPRLSPPPAISMSTAEFSHMGKWQISGDGLHSLEPTLSGNEEEQGNDSDEKEEVDEEEEEDLSVTTVLTGGSTNSRCADFNISSYVHSQNSYVEDGASTTSSTPDANDNNDLDNDNNDVDNDNNDANSGPSIGGDNKQDGHVFVGAVEGKNIQVGAVGAIGAVNVGAMADHDGAIPIDGMQQAGEVLAQVVRFVQGLEKQREYPGLSELVDMVDTLIVSLIDITSTTPPLVPADNQPNDPDSGNLARRLGLLRNKVESTASRMRSAQMMHAPRPLAQLTSTVWTKHVDIVTSSLAELGHHGRFFPLLTIFRYPPTQPQKFSDAEFRKRLTVYGPESLASLAEAVAHVMYTSFQQHHKDMKAIFEEANTSAKAFTMLPLTDKDTKYPGDPDFRANPIANVFRPRPINLPSPPPSNNGESLMATTTTSTSAKSLASHREPALHGGSAIPKAGVAPPPSESDHAFLPAYLLHTYHQTGQGGGGAYQGGYQSVVAGKKAPRRVKGKSAAAEPASKRKKVPAVEGRARVDESGDVYMVNS